MQDLVFHIGIPKTGSSALQVALARNYAQLKHQSVEYLRIGQFDLGAAGKITSGNGNFLARCLYPASGPSHITDADPHVREFLAAVAASKCDIGVISSELFVRSEAGPFSRLLDQLRETGIRPRVLYFVRNQPDFVNSAYIQQVKRHRCTEPADDVARRIYKSTSYIKYYKLYVHLCDLFGRENVLCHLYEDARTRRGGIFAALLDSIGASSEGLDLGNKEVNPSLSPVEVAIMRRLNKFNPRMRFSDFVAENSLQARVTGSEGTANLLSPELQDEIIKYFQAENTNFAKAYFGSSTLFADEERLVGTSRDADAVSVDDLIAFFGGLLVRYDERLARLEKTINEPK
jgi:hypothetical protein